MSWKAASVVAFGLLVGCLVCMVITKSLFADGPITIAVQVAAVLLMIWARVTFGLRSFHASANPTSGGIITSGPTASSAIQFTRRSSISSQAAQPHTPASKACAQPW
jgi:hypothetical protein